VVSATLSHVLPVAHLSPQPPQFASSEEMFTHAPLQQRSAAVAPHDAPSARGMATHMWSTQSTSWHALAAVQSSAVTHS
jgi:hypothetical protein